MLARIKKLFSKKEAAKPKRLIGYRKNFWGHAMNFDAEKNKDGTYSFHAFNDVIPEVGDEFLYEFTKGTGVCVFTEIKPCNNPGDMYFGKAGLVRYATDEDIEKAKSKDNSVIGFNILR